MTTIDLHKTLDSNTGPISLSFNCKIEGGEILAIYGPSGAGKTSVLRMIAGLMKPDSGKITHKDREWFGPKTSLKPQLRSAGVVFQV